ncbi:MAG: ribosomal protein S18-alanine N-acetyltransferase [Actinobacteria bacterium]|nr:ribosomal protein S18-alanine N-acetyltransferase [Actinomycetota bacterium]
MSAPLLRAATAGDLEAIMLLERTSFPSDAWSDAMMREELVSPHGHYLALEADGVLVGYAGLRAPRRAKDADIQTIAVAAASRGRGWGRMLLTALLDEAAGRGVHDVFLEVRADNPVAQALYAAEGFREEGRRLRYYQPDDVDAIVMRLDVRARSAAQNTDTTPVVSGPDADSDDSGAVGMNSTGVASPHGREVTA